ncbi:hypothetical protein BK727_13130 [Bacillus thuringiensis serovar roskildiensis]|uniref:Uncharacterized protein n=1 Tax=Bacillus thuringiensis serovar sooncheon TaxID=180891 RepID=A0A9Q5X156_BACTU|nr:hypothetical protein [Bacillus thuringiensis]OTW70613.1 hypothetical protein BK707_11395 [Bacillus thuringiensis serovar coreanensis]OTX42259.1 hypothetical protein BK724_26075 [Bacillus thuringiensis serovar sooncheon]OTX60278.1 hypothetical protein BK725_01005 [Bacillus thuringiensis serovar guiyangiensis]OTX69144.1 hypothetical protein BK727_13130 [Bacillus thuringiensis serovar roskildiensis]
MEKKRKKDHPLFYTWHGMMYRCYKPYNSHYKYYGAQGITVDERWHDFWNFVYDIDNRMPNGHLLYSSDYQLDKDLKGGKIYSLENCVILSKKENQQLGYEKLQKRIVAFNDSQKIVFDSLGNVERQLNIKHGTLTSCLKRGNVHRKTGFRFKYIS